jgi:hypothetical protein
MPTYVCSVPNGKLSDLAETGDCNCDCRHSEATGAPRFFVQVVVEEQGTSKRLLGGTLPIITFGYVAIYERDITKSSVGKSC